MNTESIEQMEFDGSTSRTKLVLDRFMDSKEVNELIDQLPLVYKDPLATEGVLQKLVLVFDTYQEQPNLLDPRLDDMMGRLLKPIRNKETPPPLAELYFKVLTIITKVRGHKIVIRHLPHEVSDFEPILSMLSEVVNVKDGECWETRYMLLLWLSIIIMMPFHMSLLDNKEAGKKPAMQRLLDIAKLNLTVYDKASDAAALLLSRFLIRPDVKDIHLSNFINWALDEISAAMETNKNLVDNSKIRAQGGKLSVLALLFKHGKRDNMLPIAPLVLKRILKLKLREHTEITLRKLSVKVVQRVGLIFLKPRVASWRYQRGSRVLAENLEGAPAKKALIQAGSDSKEEDYDIPEEVEEVIEELLIGLKDKDNVIRWSAAKGIGRITGRLPRDLADEITGSLLQLFSLREGAGAWHGGCLALAELGRRGLLLPNRLPEVVEVVQKALVFDEQKGSYSIGSFVRDSACFLCWSFARAYDPKDMAPYIDKIASVIIITAIFDREVNCRRAASAAFQENVGRQGTFPRGIDIVTTVDYFAVSSVKNCYLNLSIFIAQSEVYMIPCINHLIEKKINHWDVNIRRLASQCLGKMVQCGPKYFAKTVLPRLLTLITNSDCNYRHGCVIATAEVIRGLQLTAKNQNVADLIDKDTLVKIRELAQIYQDRKLFQLTGGEHMRKGIGLFIENCSLANLPIGDESVVDRWQNILNACLQDVDYEIKKQAASAQSALCDAYRGKDRSKLASLIDTFLLNLNNKAEHIRIGAAMALGGLSVYIIGEHLERIIEGLKASVQIKENEAHMAESRKESVRAIVAICLRLKIEPNSEADKELMKGVYECFLNGLEDYSVDSRGDIGSWVREASIEAIQNVTRALDKSCPQIFTTELTTTLITNLARHSVEKIDRIRNIAGETFFMFLYSSPGISNIPYTKELKEAFPEAECKELVWGKPADTLYRFTKLISLPPFTFPVLLGLVVSIGSLTESLVREASNALISFLRSLKDDQLEKVSETLVDIFRRNIKVDRISLALMSTLDHLLTVQCLLPVLTKEASFYVELVDLVKKELFSTKSVQRLNLGIAVLCGLLQGSDQCKKKALSQLMVYLCHRYPTVRVETSGRLYEALLTYEDAVEPGNMDSVIEILTETNWDKPLDEVKPIRNTLCKFLNIPVPKAVTSGENIKKP